MSKHACIAVGSLLGSWLAATPAAADDSVNFTAGLGLRKSWGMAHYLFESSGHEPNLHPAIFATLTIPVSAHLGIGGHLAVAKAIYAEVDDCFETITADVALALQYTDRHVTIAPWIGKHITRIWSLTDQCRGEVSDHWTSDFTSFGVTATVDILTHTTQHLAVFADVQAASGVGHVLVDDLGNGFRYDAITIGLAYRR